VDVDGALLLLREILTDLPQLTGAACVGRHALYDELPGHGHQHHDQQRQRVKLAAACCGGCPVRHQCPMVITSGATLRAAG
jgi:hypothetical protein